MSSKGKQLIPGRFIADAVYASVANLIILFLFVWEMEATRTPSALAKISFWSIVLMVGADAWLFSAVSSFGLALQYCGWSADWI